MKCPRCGSESSRVLETRKTDSVIYRRRRCTQCQHVSVSIETQTDETMTTGTAWAWARRREAARDLGVSP